MRQPWASAILAGAKRVENRSWAPTQVREGHPQWIALHAGQGTDRPPEALRDLLPEAPPGGWPRGLLGLVLVEAVEEPDPSDPWARGPFCWRIGRVVALREALERPGQLGLWDVDDEAAGALREALAQSLR